MQRGRRGILIAAFEDRLAAQAAMHELERAGFDPQKIGYALRGSDAVHGGMLTDAVGAKDGSGAVAGAVAGGIAGGLLAAGASLIIPGIGPVVAGGILTSFLGGAAAGAATGGIFGALVGLEMSEEEAVFYEQAFRSGRAIVTVEAPDRPDLAIEILRRHGGYQAQMRPPEPRPDPVEVQPKL